MSMYFFFFFFSSRRRHTRSYGDWSSDVCSSDLLPCRFLGPARSRLDPSLRAPSALRRGIIPPGSRIRFQEICGRSEERRVGKECRSGWWQCDEKVNIEEKETRSVVQMSVDTIIG